MKRLLFSLLSMAVVGLIAADSVRIDFNRKNFDESEKLPKNWGLKGKLFTRKPTYEIVRAKDGQEALRINVDRATGTILYDISGVLQKYPIMRWKWRVPSCRMIWQCHLPI